MNQAVPKCSVPAVLDTPRRSSSDALITARDASSPWQHLHRTGTSARCCAAGAPAAAGELQLTTMVLDPPWRLFTRGRWCLRVDPKLKLLAGGCTGAAALSARRDVATLGAVVSLVGCAMASLLRSSLAPMACPAMAVAMVKRIAYLGMITALRSMAMKGMLACTARIHCALNFSVCSRHMPHGKLTAAVVAPTASSLMGSACGLSSLTGLVAARAARALMMGSGHCKCPLGLKMMGARGPSTLRMGHVPPDAALLVVLGAVGDAAELGMLRFCGSGCWLRLLEGGFLLCCCCMALRNLPKSGMFPKAPRLIVASGAFASGERAGRWGAAGADAVAGQDEDVSDALLRARGTTPRGPWNLLNVEAKAGRA
mmetsp:Transcript_29154/g.74383  ORF Transcript_29154/g.74383 Transcript_29154/m.74383 type:complete len:370 (-) Transcript_29154:176-1285(-)